MRRRAGLNVPALEYLHDAGQGLPCAEHDSVLVKASNWVRDYGQGIVLDAPYLGDGSPGWDEGFRAYNRRRLSSLLDGDAVVHTARGAGASITCCDNCNVALLQ